MGGHDMRLEMRQKLRLRIEMQQECTVCGRHIDRIPSRNIRLRQIKKLIESAEAKQISSNLSPYSICCCCLQRTPPEIANDYGHQQRWLQWLGRDKAQL